MKTTLTPPPLPERFADAHKGSFGHVLVVAGSKGMTGAAALCALAAMKSGAGLTTVAAPAALLPFIIPLVPEATWLAFESGETHLVPEDVPAILNHLEAKSTTLVIGPGLGRTDATAEAVRYDLENSKRPAVIDADAIFAFKGEPEACRKVPAPCIITPHPGEMSTLLGKDTGAIVCPRPVRLASVVACDDVEVAVTVDVAQRQAHRAAATKGLAGVGEDAGAIVDPHLVGLSSPVSRDDV